MELFEMIELNPLYTLLFGTGGILACGIPIISIFIKHRKNNKASEIEKNDHTEVNNNKIQGKITIKKNKNTIINNNEFIDKKNHQGEKYE